MWVCEAFVPFTDTLAEFMQGSSQTHSGMFMDTWMRTPKRIQGAVSKRIHPQCKRDPATRPQTRLLFHQLSVFSNRPFGNTERGREQFTFR